MNLNDKKIELTYPCSWSYRVIGTCQKSVTTAIYEVILEKPHKLTYANKSANGKYHSLNLELIVTSEDERVAIFEALKQHDMITMVL